MKTYLLFPRIRVQAANMVTTSYLVGGPPVMATYGLGEALCHHVGGGASVTGFVCVHHNRQALGMQAGTIFSPQQRRGAAFTFGRKAANSDYSSKNRHALALQPTASAHMHMSLVWEFENMQDTDGVRDFLQTCRFAGGMVTHHGPLFFCATLEEALEKLGPGYAVLDRKDIMLEEMAKGNANQASVMVDSLGTIHPLESDKTWLAATCVGYAPITPFEHRAGARDGYAHAFVEPLVGLVQYRSLRQWRDEDAIAENLLWRPVWKDGGVFVVEQNKIELEAM